MLVSESWLREWTSPKISSDELSEGLTLAGLEVESVTAAGPLLNYKNVVVGQIVNSVPHENASKLNVCEVDVGKSKNLSIVCGASNAALGMKTAVALVNARLGEMTVLQREIRGMMSNGMLCSAAELGLEESSPGILEFDQSAYLGQGVGSYLDLADNVYALELTPNRGDCLGIAGVAREVSTLTGSKYKLPKIVKIKSSTRTALKVVLKSPKNCPRYVGRAMTNIDMTAKTPDWMVERLRRSGMRSINAVVDITNYVMHDLGQPMHGFDLDKIHGGIVVRLATKGEKLKLLDGSTAKLSPENLVIADKKKAIALAGIMGGENSAISDATTNLYLEAAYFSPNVILGKARQLGMHTDASHRFERGVDFELQVKAMERATQLVLEIAGGQAGPITHGVNKSALPKLPTIKFDKSEVKRILGITVPVSKINSIFKNLGMKVRVLKSGWQVTPPSWRFDLSAQHDLVEEIGRCYGFDKVPPRMPNSESRIGAHPEANLSIYALKQNLIHRGYHEAITYSFVDPATQAQLLDMTNAIPLANPISDNMSVMRQSLWPGLLEALQTNLNRQENRVRLFETGHVFLKAKTRTGSREIARIAGLVSGESMPRQWGSAAIEVDFFDLKSDLESLLNMTAFGTKFGFNPAQHPSLQPGQSAEIHQNNEAIGTIGKLHPKHQKLLDLDQSVYLFEVNLDPLLTSRLPGFSNISKFPSVQRDLAILVDEKVEIDTVMDLVRSTAGDLLKKLELFDIYQGKNLQSNKKSFAFSLTFQSESSNLTSSDVEAITKNVVGVLEQKLGAQLRT